MSTFLGNHIKFSIFGQSHGAAIGCVIDGLPAGITVDEDVLAAFMARRAPGSSPLATSRKEPDLPKIVSGLYNGKTCGAPLCAMIENTNTRSGDYANLAETPRPGHADYTARIRYKGFADMRGGGHFSGRLTAPLCIVGGICLQALEARGIRIGAHILSIADVYDDPFNAVDPAAQMEALRGKTFPVIRDAADEEMHAAVLAAKGVGDSVGGMIECAATGVPAGLGEPMFDGMENRIAKILFGIPALRGVSFGDMPDAKSSVFPFSARRGSENNDAFRMNENGDVVTETNHCGGILGGITNGMPIVFTCGIKPTPSIGTEQDSVNLTDKENCRMTVVGRHDPCIIPRAVPCVEAAAAVAIFDALLEG